MWQAKLKELENDRDREFMLRSPASEWEALVKTPVWEDIQDLLLKELVQVRDGLESLGSSATSGVQLADFAFMQGEAYTLRLLLDMPENFISQLQEEQGKSKEEESNG